MSRIDGLEGWAGEGPRLAITVTVYVHLLSGANLRLLLNSSLIIPRPRRPFLASCPNCCLYYFIRE